MPACLKPDLPAGQSIYDILLDRGYIAQTSNEAAVREMLASPQRFYIGFDPTADSLHVGHFMQLMIMRYLQAAGHQPIALMGGGTGMVGDPSGRTDLRKVLSEEQIQHNIAQFEQQIARIVDFDQDKALLVNNADWLLQLNYVAFLREVGAQFSVNRMLTAECYKQRMERGLTFLEFNYMIMQAYDFLELYRRYGCRLQIGGDDQWSNILAGADLIRRKEQAEAECLTIQLLTTKDGQKMGKTAKGALWLSADKTSPYEFYQYWRNVDDASVIQCLKLLTFLPLSEIQAYANLEGAELNQAKERLAYECCSIVHGEEAAEQAAAQARQLFAGGGESEWMDETLCETAEFEQDGGLGLLVLLERCGLVSSRSQARQLIRQGGISLNDEVIHDERYLVGLDNFRDGQMIIRRGKKQFHRVKLKS